MRWLRDYLRERETEGIQASAPAHVEMSRLLGSSLPTCQAAAPNSWRANSSAEGSPSGVLEAVLMRRLTRERFDCSRQPPELLPLLKPPGNSCRAPAAAICRRRTCGIRRRSGYGTRRPRPSRSPVTSMACSTAWSEAAGFSSLAICQPRPSTQKRCPSVVVIALARRARLQHGEPACRRLFPAQAVGQFAGRRVLSEHQLADARILLNRHGARLRPHERARAQSESLTRSGARICSAEMIGGGAGVGEVCPSWFRGP